MLSEKYGMTTHGRLLAIVGNEDWSKTFGYKIGGMTTDGDHAFFLNISLVLGR